MGKKQFNQKCCFRQKESLKASIVLNGQGILRVVLFTWCKTPVNKNRVMRIIDTHTHLYFWFLHSREWLTRAGVSDHLDAATVACLQGRLVARQGRVVEGVLAADVAPAVALVAVDGPRCERYQKAPIRLALTHSTRLKLPGSDWLFLYFIFFFVYFFISNCQVIFSREFCIWFNGFMDDEQIKVALNVSSRKSETEETNESKSCVGSRINIKLTNQNPSLQKLKEYNYRGGWWRVLLGGARHRCCRRCGNEIERKRVEREIPHTYTYGLWERLQDFASKKPR
jgi:hypothetical protein